MMGYVGSARGHRAAIERNLLIEGVLDWEMRKGDSPPDDGIKAACRGPFATRESRQPPWVLAHHLWSDPGEAVLGTVQEHTRRLARLPTLLIFGGRDRYTSSRRELPRLQQLFPHNEAVVIPGAGHFFPESAGKTMATAMRDWLARGDQSSPRRKSRCDAGPSPRAARSPLVRSIWYRIS